MEPIHWHHKECEWVTSHLGVNPFEGLSSEEVVKREAIYGKNELDKKPLRPLWQVFVGQFTNPLIYLLLVAAIVAVLLGEARDAVVIVFVVILNSIIGTFQEGRAERSLEALRKLASVPARVLRKGSEIIISAIELVPGDIILLNPGDSVPADSRLVDCFSFETNEAALTGESLPVLKFKENLPEKTHLADRTNMVYTGTFVTAGRAKAVVVSTGTETEIGKISKLAEKTEKLPTPLEKRIAQFSKYLIFAAIILFLLILAEGLSQKIPLVEIVLIGISQVVSMVPEGLPVAVTVALAVGVQRMAKKKTIVRKLSAVETLGSTTVICSDKTGTLTKNEMTVTEIRLLNGQKYTVTGVGYSPYGDFLENGKKVTPSDDLKLLLKNAILCNDSNLVFEDGIWKVIGDPTETALVVAGIKAGINKSEFEGKFPRIGEIPFDSIQKIMVTEHLSNGSDNFLAIKGALEKVLPLCNVPDRKSVIKWAEEMALSSLRVLAFAYVPKGNIHKGEIKDKAIFLGLIGQMDPPRPEVTKAIEDCKTAGIRPIMITGDHKITGLEVAKKIGLAGKNDIAIDGEELDRLSPEELQRKLENVSVFARVHPAQKLQIVEAFQKNHQVVAVTGDGVNDAPALTKADVGVAMGITGTEVAKEASKIVITDDNFSTIVSAVAEGRLVYQNIKKVVLLQFATGLAEIVILMGALFAGFAPPFVAVQILWNNLVTEGIITVNLIMEPMEGDELKRPPTSPQEPLLTAFMLKRLLLMAATISFVTLGWYIFRIKAGVPLHLAKIETFTLLVICEWYNVLNCRSSYSSGIDIRILKNKWLVGGLIIGNLLQLAVIYWRPLGDLFYTEPINLKIVPVLALVGLPVLLVEEFRKLISRKLARSRSI